MADPTENDKPLDAAEPANSIELEEKGKNKTQVLCQFCKSVVLLPGIATRVKKEFYLPHMRAKKEQTEEGETLGDFWVLDDMFKFENVSFTHTVGSIKYLACADCEIGPIGLHDTNDRTAFYVALERVNHVE